MAAYFKLRYLHLPGKAMLYSKLSFLHIISYGICTILSSGEVIVLELEVIIDYGNEIESKGVQFPGRGARDKCKRGG